ncbi:peptidase domain-containing ABC transporter [Streptomyces sp. NPDC001118]|uniref:peptidase domain-containing ABC transporter n=1 Tax=Streptomyces sp. NPDC002589 TaxID=3154420 RepID=UPI00332C264B
MGKRVPAVTQVTQTECGLCCCVAIMRYYGRDEDFSEVREVLEAGRDGLAAKQLADFLRSRGMETKAFRAKSVDALQHFTRPVILYWEEYHFVVLERFDGRHATIMDPAVGRRRLTREQLQNSFSEVVIAPEPGPGFEKRRKPVFSEWRSLPLLAERAKLRIAAVALLSLSGYLGVLGIPALTRWAVDRQAHWSSPDDVAVIIAAIAAGAVGYLLLFLLRAVVLSSLVAVMGRHLMTTVFRRLLSLPYKFFSTRQPGELLFRLNSVNAVRDLISSRIAQGILDIGTLLCVSVYLFVVQWRLGLIAAVIFLLNAVYLAATRHRVKEVADAEISQLGKSQSTQLDAVASIPTIKMGGYEQEFAADWEKTYTASLEAMKARMRLQNGWINGVTSTTQMFGPLVLLLASLYFAAHGVISLGSAIAVQAISATYFSLSTSVFQMWTEFTEVSRYMSRLADITAAQPESSGGSVRELTEASVELREVGFQYTRHSKPVLTDISIDAPAGARIALVGASGSGKSTMAKIVCGLHEPTSGQVLFGGRPAAEYDKRFLRQQIGYIPQEVHLHNRTILENLTLGQSIDEGVVREYCATVGILDFIDDLPMGLKTLVSEMGANFSGGQRQRLAIVRTLLQRPRILVMDEATASLDAVNERKVAGILEEIGATQITIAHRLSTVRNADRIYVFHNGRVVEDGTHEQLITTGGAYARLYSDQGRALLSESA